MRVYETAHVSPDGRLRLDMPVGEKDQDVYVAVVLQPQSSGVDSWSAHRARLEAAGISVPAPSTPWHVRQVEPLILDGPPISQTLVEDRR